MAGEVGMEGTIKAVGTTTEAATGVGEGEDIDVASQERISVVELSSCWIADISIVVDALTFARVHRGMHLPLLWPP